MSTQSRSRHVILLSLIIVVSVGVFSCDQIKGQNEVPSGVHSLETNTESPPVYSINVLNAFPHDCDAFTQGLVMDQGVLFEGTGLRGGASSLRRVDLETGNVEQIFNLEPSLFGEGITTFEDKIFQITWQARRGFVYDRESFDVVDEFTYSNVQDEGWGITHDGEQLIMSDGSSWIYFLDPKEFEPAEDDGLPSLREFRRVNVIDQAQNREIVRLNELEYINGWIFANVWQTELIAIIDPETGFVGAWIHLPALAPTDQDESCPRIDVLNGIAYDNENDRLFVTGKQWDTLYQIELEAP